MSPPPAAAHAPIVLSTWSFGHVANAAAWPILSHGGTAIDAVVAGASAVEDDPSVDSVGLGGLPDASGRVSLDACVMTNPEPGGIGSVCFVRHRAHVTRLARAVMDQTMHVLLAGEGAEAFADRLGVPQHPTDLLTPSSRAAYLAWRATKTDAQLAAYTGEPPPMNVEERYRDAAHHASSNTQRTTSPDPSHDTVCVLARDARGQLAGACTTSGLGFKMPGRVGDSPIVGHGLYVDQEVGAATATGNGELIMAHCGSFLAVEQMRQGREPIDALSDVIRRIVRRLGNRLHDHHQVGMLALRNDGVWASASLRPGFSCWVCQGNSSAHPAPKGLAQTSQRVVMA